LLENKFSVRPSDPSATVLINKLQDEADLYTRKVSLPVGTSKVLPKVANWAMYHWLFACYRILGYAVGQ